MIHRSPVLRFVLILVAVLVPVLACQQTNATTAPQGTASPQSAGSTTPDLPYDHELTDVARVLGGMMPEDQSKFTNITSLPSWQEYHQKMDADWTADINTRYKIVADWRDRELAAVEDNCHTLMYPFAGPDILNAYQFFPKCDTYVLYGLEMLGTTPKLDKLAAKDGDRLVADVRESLSDLFTRHYFITKTMETELSTSYVNGTLPVMLLMLARLDAHIVSVDRMVLGDKGLAASVAGAQNQVSALRVNFVEKGSSHPQSLIYFRAQAENAGLEKRPVVRAFLRSFAPFTTMLKSASYLLHDPQFTNVRDDVLEGSTAILTDDSGMPYRCLKPPKWKLTLYGQYSKPVSDFNYGYQKDLDAAYTAANPPALPFSYGYHWRDGHYGVMLAIRNPGEPKPVQ